MSNAGRNICGGEISDQGEFFFFFGLFLAEDGTRPKDSAKLAHSCIQIWRIHYVMLAATITVIVFFVIILSLSFTSIYF